MGVTAIALRFGGMGLREEARAGGAASVECLAVTATVSASVV